MNHLSSIGNKIRIAIEYKRTTKKDTSGEQLFGSHLNPISTGGGGGQIMPTLYWCPHQVLKATGAPGL